MKTSKLNKQFKEDKKYDLDNLNIKAEHNYSSSETESDPILRER